MAKTPWEKWQEEKKRLQGGTGVPDTSYKKLGESCTHPVDKREVEEGKFGKYVICLLCGAEVGEDGSL